MLSGRECTASPSPSRRARSLSAFAQGASEHSAGPEEPAHHGSDGNVEGFGSLAIRVVTEVDELHYAPELLRKSGERRVHPTGDGEEDRSCGRSSREGRIADESLEGAALSRAAPASGDEHALEDLIHPGAQVGAALKGRLEAERTDDRLLNQILGIGTRSGEPQRARL